MKYPRPTYLPAHSVERLEKLRAINPHATPRLDVIRDYSQIVRKIRRRQLVAARKAARKAERRRGKR